MVYEQKNLEGKNEVPEYIQKYILEYDHHIRMETELLKLEAAKTKYDEWVVVSIEENADRYPYVWITNFEYQVVNNMFPMFLIIDNESFSLKIGDIKVLGDNRSKGYGSLFMKELFEIVEARKIVKISGWAQRPDDPNLVNFYKKFGINIIGSNLCWERT